MALNVATTILQQLGGNRFVAMTGAKDLMGDDKMLMFRLPRGAKDGINKVRITLEDNDLYTVEFFKYAKLEMQPKGKVENVYFDMLQKIFTSHTGLETRL